MARGICSPLKQVLGYFFTHRAASASDLEEKLLECYHCLLSAGLRPKVVTCDQGIQNISLLGKLVTTVKPYLTIGDEKLFFIFDPSHLLKCLCNILLKYDFQVCNHIIRAQHIRDAFAIDKQFEIRSMPRLTDGHFNLTSSSKMKVKLAAHIFSNHVAASMFTLSTFHQLSPDAIHTARFVERVNRLFDTLNSSHLHGNTKYSSAIQQGSAHKDFLLECLSEFEKITVLRCKRPPPCIRGFCLTMTSVLQLSEDLRNSGIQYLLTRRLNQDALENTFCIIRTKCGSNPDSSCIQFQAAVRHLLLRQLFKTTQGSNYAEDVDSLLAAIFIGPNYMSRLGCSAATHITDDVIVAPSESPSPLGSNSTTFFAGWLGAKFHGAHTCPSEQKCKLLEDNATFQDSSQLLLYLSVKNVDSTDFGKLSVPLPAFATFVGACEEAFKANVKTFFTSQGVRSKLCEVLDTLVPKTLSLCSSSVCDDLFHFFLRVRVFWFAQHRNEEVYEIVRYVKRHCSRQ
ncbi:uncharacterized protein LOC135389273 [Ornithodoros turicata]|uniref:uncharacterized protein LOC135389273 n=1 Tax=Ornithodoros turicata TaxID=34597 RepID=UPI0031396E38